MVEVICEKSGLRFESATKRTKNHPQIMGWINDAYKDGWYQQCLNIIKEGREQGWTTMEQFAEALRDAEMAAKAEQNAHIAAENQRKREREEARRQRSITNSLLRGRGYNWQKWENDEEDVDLYGAPEVEWTLLSPDNRAVSMKQAMLELAFYEDAQFAHEWLAKCNIAEELPEVEKKRREGAAKVQAQIVYTDEQIAYQQEAVPALLECGFVPEIAEREAKRLSLPHQAWEDHVELLGPEMVSGRSVFLVINGDFRYGAFVDDEWYGLEELLQEFPDFPSKKMCQLYIERNNKRNAR